MKLHHRARTLRATIGITALLICSAGGVPAATAGEPVSNDVAFQSFVSELKVDEGTRAALAEKFNELSETKQRSFLDEAAADPLSVMEFEDASEPTLSAAGGIQSRAAASRYTATYPVNANMFGITTGTFNLRYVFEATPSAVTRNLECTGWFSGVGGVWSINSTSSQYISGGIGTCSVTHRMSFLYKGSAWSANKHHQLSYRGTTLTNGWLKNV
ncbi:hypothetical protein KNO15_13095 [Leifsonia shinshuensis]|uniref:hypothetical protein n=1 Tax=Leifsonia shinshuensis TaxID=150026 RepID=UPI001F507B37|nr:hypothetical protein [Leifsonia shinshuensis]MCI0157631.1 hypothetical protein [Leifsonia shinshuensis]